MNGFNLDLEDFCAYCGNFREETTTICASTLEEKRFIHNISCHNIEVCRRMNERLKKLNENG